MYCLASIQFSATTNVFLQPEAVPPISELGPDALLEPLQIDELVDALSKKNTAIKALLLDQVDFCLPFFFLNLGLLPAC